jgi:hypothetical protein
LIAAIFGLQLVGCATGSPGPRGPLLGPGVEISEDIAAGFGPSTVDLADGTHANGLADNTTAATAVGLLRGVEGRLSPIKWCDVGGRVGWIGSGLDVRLGRPAAPDVTWAFAVDAGFETGRAALMDDFKGLRSRWVRLELYPWVPLFPADSTMSLRLVIAAGVNTGTFYRALPDPRNRPGAQDISVLRPETRIEGSLGAVFFPPRLGVVMLTANPYLVAHAGTPAPRCQGCDAIASYSHSWGVLVTLHLALRRALDFRALAQGSVTVE